LWFDVLPLNNIRDTLLTPLSPPSPLPVPVSDLLYVLCNGNWGIILNMTPVDRIGLILKEKNSENSVKMTILTIYSSYDKSKKFRRF